MTNTMPICVNRNCVPVEHAATSKITPLLVAEDVTTDRAEAIAADIQDLLRKKTEGQRAMAAARRATRSAGGAHCPPSGQWESREELATEYDVPLRMIKSARDVLKHCPQELIDLVESGRMPINTALVANRKAKTQGKQEGKAEQRERDQQTPAHKKIIDAFKGMDMTQKRRMMTTLNGMLGDVKTCNGSLADDITFSRALTTLEPLFGKTFKTISHASGEVGQKSASGRRSDPFARIVAYAQGHPAFNVTWRKKSFRIDYDSDQKTLSDKVDKLQSLDKVHDDIGAEATMYAYYLLTQVDAWFHTVGGFDGVVVDDPGARDSTADALLKRVTEFVSGLKRCTHVRN